MYSCSIREKKCAYFGLFVLFWDTQVNKIMCDLQIKVAVAEGLLVLREGAVSHSNFIIILSKDTG